MNRCIIDFREQAREGRPYDPGSATLRFLQGETSNFIVRVGVSEMEHIRQGAIIHI